MKFFRNATEPPPFVVVPHVGTWIEIGQGGDRAGGDVVVPHVGTWIEIGHSITSSVPEQVVPHVGTWIEIDDEHPGPPPDPDVVPHVGTWIEIRSLPPLNPNPSRSCLT